MAKILVVDDEKDIVDILTAYFHRAGHMVYAASSGDEALRQASCRPDIILLDINMPGMDGLTVCERIREHINCPILFLTARVETADKIRGLRVGGDDYIVKPFDLEELGARVEAHLRRENRNSKGATVRFFGELTVDYGRRQVSIDGEAVNLSRREFDIVDLLSLNAGQVFSRERIYEHIWGLEGDGSSDTIMEHIRKIRLKFSRLTKRNYIETVWGCGYKWNG